MRPNGSLWSDTSPPASKPCRVVTINVSNSSAASRLWKSATSNSASGSFPRRTLVASSHAEAALTNTSLRGSVIAARAAGPTASRCRSTTKRAHGPRSAAAIVGGWSAADGAFCPFLTVAVPDVDQRPRDAEPVHRRDRPQSLEDACAHAIFAHFRHAGRWDERNRHSKFNSSLTWCC